MVKVWDTNNGRILSTYNFLSKISVIKQAHKAPMIAAGSFDGKIKVLKLEPGLRPFLDLPNKSN